MVQGENLEERSRPAHITEAEEELLGERSKLPGRWVNAGDLRPGDILFLRDGRQVAINAVQPFREHQVTYNFAVDDLHCYAVGSLEILVHNSCSANARELRKNMGSSISAAEEAHHIVPSGHRRGVEAREILEKYGIGINDAVNGVGLIASKHRGVELHSYRSIDAVTDRLRAVTINGGIAETIRQRLIDVLDEIRAEIKLEKIPGITQ